MGQETAKSIVMKKIALLKKLFTDKNSLLYTLAMYISLVVACFFFTILLGTANAGNDSFPNDNYKKSNDYKAIVQAFFNDKPILRNGLPVLGHAWNYDTAQDSVKAATAYCIKINNEFKNIAQYKVLFLGNIPFSAKSNLKTSVMEYEQKVINDLKKQLRQTGKRDIITTLSTILQKTGEYKLSENLLLELAMGGEHLAQNALAYHWAELSKNLPMALAFANNAVSKDSDFFSYHDTKALVLFRLGQTKEALKTSSKAVSLAKHPIALDHYGDILWKTGHKTEAVNQWNKSLAVSKDILFIQRLQLKIKNGMTRDIVFE